MNRRFRALRERREDEYEKRIQARIERHVLKKHAPQTQTFASGRHDLNKVSKTAFDTDWGEIYQELWASSTTEQKRLIVYACCLTEAEFPRWTDEIRRASSWFYEAITRLGISKGALVMPYTLPVASAKCAFWAIFLGHVSTDGGSLFSNEVRLESGEPVYWTQHAIDRTSERLGLRNTVEDAGTWLNLMRQRPHITLIDGVEFAVRFCDGVDGEIPYLYHSTKWALVKGVKALVLTTTLLPGMAPCPPSQIEGVETATKLREDMRLVWVDGPLRREMLSELGFWREKLVSELIRGG